MASGGAPPARSAQSRPAAAVRPFRSAFPIVGRRHGSFGAAVRPFAGRKRSLFHRPPRSAHVVSSAGDSCNRLCLSAPQPTRSQNRTRIHRCSRLDGRSGCRSGRRVSSRRLPADRLCRSHEPPLSTRLRSASAVRCELVRNHRAIDVPFDPSRPALFRRNRCESPRVPGANDPPRAFFLQRNPSAPFSAGLSNAVFALLSFPLVCSACLVLVFFFVRPSTHYASVALDEPSTKSFAQERELGATLSGASPTVSAFPTVDQR